MDTMVIPLPLFWSGKMWMSKVRHWLNAQESAWIWPSKHADQMCLIKRLVVSSGNLPFYIMLIFCLFKYTLVTMQQNTVILYQMSCLDMVLARNFTATL